MTDTLSVVRVLACLPPLVLAAVIWQLSDTPNLTIAQGVLDTVLRKIAHMCAFGVLAATCVLAVRAQGSRAAVSITTGVVVALSYAMVDEYHQTFVPTRHGALTDVAIDAFGIGIASIVMVKVFTHRGVA